MRISTFAAWDDFLEDMHQGEPYGYEVDYEPPCECPLCRNGEDNIQGHRDWMNNWQAEQAEVDDPQCECPPCLNGEDNQAHRDWINEWQIQQALESASAEADRFYADPDADYWPRRLEAEYHDSEFNLL